jgi:DNA-binding winged helix-turn-helix (wHTH) protein
MSESQATRRLIRFGAFEADVQTGELRKNGVKLKFSGQPFQVLAILLERPGEVVTREELQKRLWPDTFVDVERNLNTAVNKIREVLGDSAETPRFIETLPRRGYRFIGELERPIEPSVEPAIEPLTTVEPDRCSDFRKLWWTVAAGVLTIAIIAVITGGIFRRSKPQRPQEQSPLTAVPFTALPGQATAAAFSPDGSRIAFAWDGDPKGGPKGYDLYVKGMGSETLLRLTQHPSKWISAAWSPDGTQIAFHRISGPDSGLYSVPALGGPEKKLRSTGVFRRRAIATRDI